MNEQSQKDLLLFPFEIALFCSLAYVIFKMKKYSPALLFPPQGVTVVLPPDEEDLKEPDGKDRKAKLTTPQLVQIKTIKSDANQFMQAPFSSELEITMLFLVMLMAQFTIVEIIKIIAQYFGYSLIESGMLFYFGLIILIMIIRNIFKAATIGGFDSEQTKMSIVVCIMSSLIVIMVNIGFKDYLEINIKHEFQRQGMHLEIVLHQIVQPGLFSFMSQFGDVFIVLMSLVVAFITFCILPVLIRFGNCFAEMKNEIADKQKQGKGIKKSSFYILVLQLVVPLVYLALYLKPFTKELKPVFFFQSMALLVMLLLWGATYTLELEKHMAKGYEWALVLKEQPEHAEYVKKKISALLRGMVIVGYQLMSKIAIPLLLFMILIVRNQTVLEGSVRHTQLPAKYSEAEVFCVKKQVNMMEFLFAEGEANEGNFGGQVGPLDESKVVVKRISNYGFLSKSFIYTLVEFVLYNQILVMEVLSIFYIFFLNKTKAVKQNKPKAKKEKDKGKKQQ